MKALALDLSLNSTGIAWGYVKASSKGKVEIKWLKTKLVVSKKIKDQLDKIENVRRGVMRKVKKFKPKHIFIEGQAYAAKGQATRSIAQLHGVVMCCLRKHGFDPALIPPTTVKKVITGKGNSKKSMIMKAIYKRFRLDIDDEDMADAAAILITGVINEKQK